MTIILSVFGLIVFLISLFTAGFKTAFTRFMTFVIAGFVIDMLVVTLAVTIGYVTF